MIFLPYIDSGGGARVFAWGGGGSKCLAAARAPKFCACLEKRVQRGGGGGGIENHGGGDAATALITAVHLGEAVKNPSGQDPKNPEQIC